MDGASVAPRDARCCDEFRARDLLLHLQENEGYEVYEYFEASKGPKGSKVLAPRRLWVEVLETVPISPASASADGEAASGEDPWVVLLPSGSPCATPPPPRPPPQRPVKGDGKGRPPPPPGGHSAKAKGPPGRPPAAKAKGSAPAKASSAPPPFGKKLHWKPLPELALGDTIFEELRDEAAPPLDREQLERIFQPPPKPPMRERIPSDGSDSAAKGKGGATGAGQARRSIGSQVCLLDAKRAQNLAIVLRQVTLPTEELAEVLRCMRVGHKVAIETLEHVYDNLVPSLLECPDLVNYDGPTENLRDVERQLLPLARLPRLKARLRTMLFCKKMPVQQASLLERIRVLRSACEQVRNSSALRRIMCAGLRVGNFLNHGIENAGEGAEVRGFAMESLLKFRDFRAAHGGEASALHCIVVHLCPHHPELLQQLRQELQILFPVDGVDVASLDGITDLHYTVGCFQSEIDLVQGELERFSDSYASEGQGPLEVMRRSLEDGCEIVSKLNEELRATLATSCRLLEYFGERQPAEQSQESWASSYAAVEKFFATIKEVVISFEECWREVRENPKKLRLEGLAPPPSASGNKSATSGGKSGVPAPTPQLTAVKQSPKAAAAAACAAAAASAASERQAKSVANQGANNETADKAAALAADAASAVLRRRRGSGMLRLGGPDFGGARLQPHASAAMGE